MLMNMHTETFVFVTSQIQRANITQQDMQIQDEGSLLMELADKEECSQQMKLVKQIALLRFIIAKKRPKIVEQLITILSQEFFNNNQEKQLSDNKISAFFSNQSCIVDQQLAWNFQRSLLLCLKARQVVFRKIFEGKNGQRYTIKTEERPFNHLLEMLKFNHEYSQICGGQPDFVPLAQLAEIFGCDPADIEYFRQVYLDCRTRISRDHICPEHSFIFMFIFAKLKTEVSKGLTKFPFPKEIQIQRQFFKLFIFHKKQDEDLKSNEQFKMNFSQLCAKQNRLSDMKIRLRRNILTEAKQIMYKSESPKQVQPELERICGLYRIKKQQLVSQVKKLKNGQSSLITVEQKTRNIMGEIYIARYTGHHDSLKSMVTTFYKKYGKSVDSILQFIGVHCQQQTIAMKQMEERNLCKICQHVLTQMMHQQQVVFIDFEPFYKQQFNDYNILMNRDENILKYTSFVPANDVVFFFVSAISNKRIVFHSLIMQNLTGITYINNLKEIFDIGYSSIPKIVGLFMSIRLQNHEWKRLSDFIQYIEKRGFLVFILPTSEYMPNVNAYVSDLLRDHLLVECSQYLNEVKMEQFKKQLQVSADSFMHSSELRNEIKNFMKVNWT